MKGPVCVYLWVCAVAYFARDGGALSAILGNELVASEEEGPGLVGWRQGQETPLRRVWNELEEPEEDEGGEMEEMSPDDDKRQYPGGKRQYPGGKRQYPGGKRQYPGGKRQYPGGKRQYPGGKRQYPGGKRQYLAGKRQFVGGEETAMPELRQYPGGKRQYPGGKRQYLAGKRQYLAGKRQYPGGKRSEGEEDLFPMETRQYPGGKRQYLAGKRQYLAGKRQYPGGKRQFPGGKRQFIGGEPQEFEATTSKRFAPEDENVDFIKLAQMYEINNDMLVNEEDLEIEDMLDNIMVDTRPDPLLGNADEDALAIDLSTLLQERNDANW